MSEEGQGITGIVKAVRKDGKGLLLATEKNPEGTWYSNQFLSGKLSCQKGQFVEVVLNDKGFLNNVVFAVGDKPNIPTPANPTRPQQFAKKDDDKLVSVYISYAKDLCVAGKIGLEEIEQTAIKLLESHKKIKSA